MKEAAVVVFGVVVVSLLALGVVIYPSATGQAFHSHEVYDGQYGTVISDGQYSPAQYGYFRPDYSYPTQIQRCLYTVPCQARDDQCLSGSAIYVDSVRMGCAMNSGTPWCAHFRVGWNAAADCSHSDRNLQTQCICP